MSERGHPFPSPADLGPRLHTDKAPAPGDETEANEEYSPELRPYVEEAKKFLREYTGHFRAVARDNSLQFEAGMQTCIDLQKKIIYLSVEKFKMMKEQGMNFWQIIASVCHELGHYFDLAKNPKGMLDNFRYMERRAGELLPKALEIIKQTHNPIPDYLEEMIVVDPETGRSIPWLQAWIYKRIHRFYNALDDVYVNRLVQHRVSTLHPIFGRQGAQWNALYRDFLFPSDPNQRGETPQEGEPYDMLMQPKSEQFCTALLRGVMVPHQAMIMGERVRQVLDSPQSPSIPVTLRDRIVGPRGVLSVGIKESEDPEWRYKKIRAAVEPAFLELFFEDLEKNKFPLRREDAEGKGQGKGKGKKGSASGDMAPPSKDKGEKGEKGDEKDKKDGDGEGGQWDTDITNPEWIDAKTVKDFIKQQKDVKKTEKLQDKLARMTPDEREKYAKRQEIIDRLSRFDIPEAEKLAEQYTTLLESVEPYRKDLAETFRKIMESIRERMVQFWMTGFTSGRFDVDRMIAKFGPELASGKYGSVDWERLNVHDRREVESRLSLHPNRIRVRLVIDGSGSMSTERILAAQQLAVLFMGALGSAEAEINMAFKLSEPFIIDTEVWMYGSPGNARRIKTFASLKTDPLLEQVERVAFLQHVNSGYGGTCEAEPLWLISQTITPDDEQQIKEGRIRDFLFLFTDGGTNEKSGFYSGKNEKPVEEEGEGGGSEAAQDSRNAAHRLGQKGVIARAVQLDQGLSDTEKNTFTAVWGDHGSRVSHPSQVAEEISNQLAEELKKLQFQIDYYEVNEPAADDETEG